MSEWTQLDGMPSPAEPTLRVTALRPKAASACAPPQDDSILWQERVARLTRVNQDDLAEAFGVKGVPLLEPLLRAAGRATARRFAEKVLLADRAVGERGLQAGAEWGLGAFHTALRVAGAERVPREGPVLFVSNHPGMADTLALFASIPRPGLRTLAARRPFLELLPHLSAPLLWVEENNHSNRPALRAAVRHLRAGGAVLTFPGGAIEPDPAVYAGLEQALDNWTTSIDLIARLTPGLCVVPVLVSGVISTRAARSPLRRLRRTREGRDLLGAMLQLAVPTYRDVTAIVRFGAPIATDCLVRAGDAPVTRAAVAAMRALLETR